jgi:hypothetical protein
MPTGGQVVGSVSGQALLDQAGLAVGEHFVKPGLKAVECKPGHDGWVALAYLKGADHVGVDEADAWQ